MAIAADATGGDTKAEIAKVLKGKLPQDTALNDIVNGVVYDVEPEDIKVVEVDIEDFVIDQENI